MDKLFIVFLVFVLAIGFAVINQHNNGYGWRSAISRIIDLGGLMRKEEPHGTIVKHEKDYYHFEYKRRLVRLMEKRRDIEMQRMKLVEDRRKILGQLFDIDQEVIVHANQINEVLKKDKKALLRKFPQLEDLCLAIKDVYQINDPNLREEMYNRIKEEIWVLFRSISENPEEVDELILVIEEIEEIAREGMDAQIDGCADVSKCLDEDIECLKDVFLQQVDSIFKEPEINFDKIVELTKLLQFENKLISNNTEGTEDLFWEGTQRLEIEFKDLVEQLVKVTEENMLILMDFHDEFESEQRMLFENLTLNKERFFKYQKNIANQIKPFILGFKVEGNLQAAGSFINKYKNHSKKRVEHLKAYHYNHQKIETSLINSAQDREDFIYDIAGSAGIDLDALMAKRRAEEQEQRKKAAKSRMEWKDISNRNRSAYEAAQAENGGYNSSFDVNLTERDKARANKDELIRQRIRQDELKRRMQKAREKAKEASYNN